MAKRKTDAIAKAAAAAATAAVNASANDDGPVWLFNNEPDGDDDEAEQLNDEILEGLQQIADSAGQDLCWWELYCDAPLEKAGLVRKMGTSELKGLQTECLGLGPGDYHVIARTKRGRFVKGSRQRIQISGFARPASSSPAPATPAIDPLTLMTQLEAKFERQREARRAERMQEIKFWAPILAPIGIELAKGLFGRNGGESMKDLVGALVGMKELVGGGSGKDVENLLKGIELARDLEPGNSKGSTWPDVVVNGLTSIVKETRPLMETLAARKNGTPAPAPAATQLQFQPAAAPASSAAPGSSTPAADQQQPTTQGDSMLSMVEPLLRRLAADLEDFASNAAEPMLAAEALLVKIPRTVRAMVQPEQLKGWLNQPEWWEHLVRFHPPIQPYQAYCDDVRLGVLELMDPQQPAAGEDD